MRFASLTLVTLALGSWLSAQSPEPVAAQAPPQSARQALIEMFLSKAPGAFEKHLPDLTHKALLGKSAGSQYSIVNQISKVGQQWSAGGHLETFDEGSLLLVSEQAGSHEKIEVLVEQDSLMGEEDIIEVSVHSYENGEPEFIPVLPRLAFTLKQENEIWKLSEVTISGRVPLEDPDYLKGIRKEQDDINERMVVSQVGIMASMENDYASAHPDKGYTCKMTELYASQTVTPTEEESGTAESAQVPEDSNGYHFSLQGCNGAPATKFQITAVPKDAEFSPKAYCTDQSRKVRVSTDGKGPSCLSSGEPFSSETEGKASGVVE